MRDLNLFTSKGGVSAHYIPHMIMSRRNWYYNKHLQVEFGAYSQTSQVNDPKNTNRPRTFNGMYLYPVPNFQGGHQIMDLQTGQLITIPKVVNIPITDVMINNVEKWRRRKYLSH